MWDAEIHMVCSRRVNLAVKLVWHCFLSEPGVENFHLTGISLAMAASTAGVIYECSESVGLAGSNGDGCKH